MSNVSKDFKVAPIFQGAQREATSYAALSQTEGFSASAEDMPFESYGIREGEVLKFPSKLLEQAQRVRPSATAKNGWIWIVPCESHYNGKVKSTWFNVSSFKRQDVDQAPMHPSWYNLGNLEARVNKLEDLGEIKGIKTATFKTPKEFVLVGGRLQPKRLENGKIDTQDKAEVMVTTADGSPLE